MTLPHTLYEGVPGSPTTSILDPFAAGHDTSLTVLNASVLPDAPNRATIMTTDKLTFVTVRYSSISGNTLLGLVVEEGTIGTYPIGSLVLRNFTHLDDWDTKRDVIHLDENKVDSNQGADNAGKYLRIDTDGTVYPDEVAQGTVDYTDLINKPQINSVTLEGNRTLQELGIAAKSDLDHKVNQRDGSLAFEVGEDALGTYIWT